MGSLRRLLPFTVCKSKWWLPTRLISTSEAAGEDIEPEGRPHTEIPGPRSLPFIGTRYKYLPYIGEYDPERQVAASEKKQKKYGNVVREEVLPGVVYYNLYDPVDFEKMLRGIGKYPIRPLMEAAKKYREENGKANGLAELNGKEWHRLRQGVQQYMMNVAGVQRFLPLQGGVANDLARNIRHRRDSISLEVNDLMIDLYKWSLESISVAIFGHRIGCMDLNLAPDSMPHRFIETVGSIFTALSKTLMHWSLHESGKTELWKQLVKDMDFLYEIFAVKEEECLRKYKEEKSDVVPLMIAMMSNENLSEADVQTAVADLFFAGAEATANTLGFLLYNLAKNPEVQEKLHDEIKRIITPGVALKPTAFNNAPYLKAVIKENFRTNPPSTGLMRMIQQDSVFAGYKIPKGSMVHVHNAVAGLSEKYVDSPKEFKPERWLEEDTKSNVNPYIVAPFGHGTRVCVGKRFAEQELYLGLSAIISDFKVEYHHEDIGMKNRLIAFPDKPLRFKFIDRK